MPKFTTLTYRNTLHLAMTSEPHNLQLGRSPAVTVQQRTDFAIYQCRYIGRIRASVLVAYHVPLHSKDMYSNTEVN